MNMIRIKAVIKLYNDGRKTPFTSGYRPLFDFIEETKTSGQITLIDREVFYPGDEGIVEIAFLHRRALVKNIANGVTGTDDQVEENMVNLAMDLFRDKL